MSIKYNLRNRQILKKVNGKYIKPETRNRLYKIIRNNILSNKQHISKFEAEKIINLINRKTKEIPKINLKEKTNKNTFKTYHRWYNIS